MIKVEHAIVAEIKIICQINAASKKHWPHFKKNVQQIKSLRTTHIH